MVNKYIKKREALNNFLDSSNIRADVFLKGYKDDAKISVYLYDQVNYDKFKSVLDEVDNILSPKNILVFDFNSYGEYRYVL